MCYFIFYLGGILWDCLVKASYVVYVTVIIVVKKISDGCICKECIRKCDLFVKPLSWKYVSAEKVRNAIHAQEANNDLLKIFSFSKTVGGHLTVDETNQLWKLDFLNVIFSYNDIVDFELLEDGESITKGGLGRAVVVGTIGKRKQDKKLLN